MISKHVSIKEGTRSRAALRLGIDNEPTNEEYKNMALIADRVFEPLRKWVGGPIRINSFFRCEALNKAVGGSKKSQHMKGQAMDIDDTYGFKTNAEMFAYIREHLDFDTLIWEFGNDYNPAWVHVSYLSATENRKRVFKASKTLGKTLCTLL